MKTLIVVGLMGLMLTSCARVNTIDITPTGATSETYSGVSWEVEFLPDDNLKFPLQTIFNLFERVNCSRSKFSLFLQTSQVVSLLCSYTATVYVCSEVEWLAG